MKTVSFHSVKGGVGRTNAVINFGRAMRSLGRRVLVLELDFDAPGIVHKLNWDQEPRSDIPLSGYVDYLAHFRTEDRVFGDLTEDAFYSQEDLDSAKREYLQEIWFDLDPDPSPESAGGSIKAIRAGADDESYWWKLSSNWFHDLFSVSQNEYSPDGAFLLHANKNLLISELNILRGLRFDDGECADILAIDCRSSREYASVPLYYWSDVVVHMFPHNAEGFNGATRVAEAFYACNIKPQGKRRFLPVVTRVPESFIPGLPEEKVGGFCPATHWKEHINTLKKQGWSGLPSTDVGYRRSTDINEDITTSKLFFVQEAVFATHDERLVNAPNHYQFSDTKKFGRYYHRVLCDQARVFNEVQVFLECEGPDEMGGDERDWNPTLRELKFVRAMAGELVHQRFDLNVSQTDEGQAVNADGNKNVLLRNESLQTLFKTLEDRVKSQLNKIGAPVSKASDAASGDIWGAFYQSGRDIGLDFGIQVVRDLNPDEKSELAMIQELVRLWCQFDSSNAAFGLMSPSFQKSSINISWKKPFLLGELQTKDIASEPVYEYEISYAALGFLSGYVQGNVHSYSSYLKIKGMVQNGATNSRIRATLNSGIRQNAVSARRGKRGKPINGLGHNGLKRSREDSLMFSVRLDAS